MRCQKVQWTVRKSAVEGRKKSHTLQSVFFVLLCFVMVVEQIFTWKAFSELVDEFRIFQKSFEPEKTVLRFFIWNNRSLMAVKFFCWKGSSIVMLNVKNKSAIFRLFHHLADYLLDSSYFLSSKIIFNIFITAIRLLKYDKILNVNSNTHFLFHNFILAFNK